MGRGQSRQQRRASARGPRGRDRGWLIWAVSAVVVVGLAAAFIASRRSGTADAPSGLMRFSVPRRFHTQGKVSYPQTPPVGGDHAPVWQNCGFYSAEVTSETAVHALEHGAVWITYRASLANDQIDALRQLARSQTFVLISSFPNLPAPVVASAWGVQLRLDSATDPRLNEFVRAFRLGPETPEPGAPCTRGVGIPQ